MTLSQALTIINFIGILIAGVMGYARLILPLKEKIDRLEKDNTILMHENKENHDQINNLKVQNSELLIELKHLTQLVQEIRADLKARREY
jgi:hypothetical protein